jgi:hypothetical protein
MVQLHPLVGVIIVDTMPIALFDLGNVRHLL